MVSSYLMSVAGFSKYIIRVTPPQAVVYQAKSGSLLRIGRRTTATLLYNRSVRFHYTIVILSNSS